MLKSNNHNSTFKGLVASLLRLCKKINLYICIETDDCKFLTRRLTQVVAVAVSYSIINNRSHLFGLVALPYYVYVKK